MKRHLFVASSVIALALASSACSPNDNSPSSDPTSATSSQEKSPSDNTAQNTTATTNTNTATNDTNTHSTTDSSESVDLERKPAEDSNPELFTRAAQRAPKLAEGVQDMTCISSPSLTACTPNDDKTTVVSVLGTGMKPEMLDMLDATEGPYGSRIIDQQEDGFAKRTYYWDDMAISLSSTNPDPAVQAETVENLVGKVGL